MKWIIAILAVFAPLATMACTDGPVAVTIEAVMEDLPVYTSKRSRELQSDNALGLYKGQKIISMQRSGIGYNNCVKVASVDIKLTLKSEIYIAQEVVGIPCFYKSTYEHEMQHFKNSYEAIYNARPLIVAEAKRLYSPAVVGRSRAEIERYLDQRDEILKNYFVSITNTEHLDNAMDTPENYARESNRCPRSDQIALDRKIKF